MNSFAALRRINPIKIPVCFIWPIPQMCERSIMDFVKTCVNIPNRTENVNLSAHHFRDLLAESAARRRIQLKEKRWLEKLQLHHDKRSIAFDAIDPGVQEGRVDRFKGTRRLQEKRLRGCGLEFGPPPERLLDTEVARCRILFYSVAE